MNTAQQVARLIALGFDLTHTHGRIVHPRCSQCQFLAINGVATHETGCPNAIARAHCQARSTVEESRCPVNALNPSHASLIAEVTALRASLSDAVELVESLRADRDALRAACLEALNDCTHSACDKDRRLLAQGASAACVDKLRAAIERSAP